MVFDISQLKHTHTHRAVQGSSAWPGAAPSSLAKQLAGWVLFLVLLELGPRYSQALLKEGRPGSGQGGVCAC